MPIKRINNQQLMARLLFTGYTRGRWDTAMNLIVSLLGATLGYGDILRFPVFVLRQKGSFLIAFFLIILIIGIPLVVIELFLGQFTSKGPIDCWHFSPAFTGVGVGSLLLATFFILFYQIYIAWSALYIFKSFTLELPWMNCSREWATDHCYDFLPTLSATECAQRGWMASENGTCYNQSNTFGKIEALWNSSLALKNNIRQILPAEQYFINCVVGLHDDRPTSIYSLRDFHLGVVGCLSLVWVLTAVVLFQRLQSIVRILNISVIYIFSALIIQLIHSFTLDGAINGIDYFLKVDINILSRAEVWQRAANQVFFTLSVNTGVLICLASFSSFKGDCFCFAFIMAAGNALVSVLSGFITFAVFGSMCKTMKITIEELEYKIYQDEFLQNIIGFVVFSYSVARFPAGALWSVVFFFMLFLVGITTTTIYLQSIVTSLLDFFPYLRLHKKYTLTVLFSVFFLLELPMTTNVGILFINNLEKGIFSFCIFALSFLQCTALAWVYGVRNFMQDISFILGDIACSCLPWRFSRYGLAVSWTVLIPIFTGYNMFQTTIEAIQNIENEGGKFKLIVSCLILLPVPVIAVITIFNIKKSCLQRLQLAVRPTERWGPELLKNRCTWLAARPNVPLVSVIEMTSTLGLTTTLHTDEVTTTNAKHVLDALRDEMSYRQEYPNRKSSGTNTETELIASGSSAVVEIDIQDAEQLTADVTGEADFAQMPSELTEVSAEPTDQTERIE